jgi:hypothetical protein
VAVGALSLIDISIVPASDAQQRSSKAGMIIQKPVF